MSFQFYKQFGPDGYGRPHWHTRYTYLEVTKFQNFKLNLELTRMNNFM